MSDASRHDTVSHDMARAFGGIPVTKGPGLESSIVLVGSTTSPAPRRRHWLRLAGPIAVAALLTGLFGVSEFGGRNSVVNPAIAAAPRLGQPALTGSVPALATRSDQALQPPYHGPISLSMPVAAPAPAMAPLTVAINSPRRSPVVPDQRTARDRSKHVDEVLERDGHGQRPSQVADSATSRDGCAPNSQSNDCIYADVMRADRRLRAAYTQAVRLGVPTDALVPAMRRWRQARAIAQEKPDEAIRLYGALAYDLDGYTADSAP